MGQPLRDRLRRFPVGLLGMLAIVAAAESFIAGNDLRFSRIEAEDWKSTAEVANGQLPSGGILFYGDSQVKFGVSPLLLESKLGQPSQCLAIQGGQAPSTYFLLKKSLDSGVVPSALVVDFEPHLLRDGIDHNRRMWAELANVGECLDLARTAGKPEEFASMALARLLPSYRERFEIRDNIKAALRGETPAMPSWLEMTARNRGMNRGALAISKTQPGRGYDPNKWGQQTTEPWAPDPVNEVYARKFIKLAMDHHIPVYCMLMPVIPEVQENYEKNGMDKDYFAWLRKLQEKFPNLYILDYRHSDYTRTAFTDELHLDLEGAASITTALGDYLQKSFKGEGIDVRWVKMPAFKAEATQIAVEDTSRSDAFMRSTVKLRR